MKKSLLKHDKFFIWILRMRAGERKNFQPQETNRGLTEHGSFTLNAISVFVSGKFQTMRHNRPPYVHEAGTGGASYLDADSWLDHSVVCLEDGEYHCISPVGPPRFWSRSVLSLGPGDQFRCSDEWVWNATSRKLVNIQNGFFSVEEPSVIARMWLEPSVST